MRFHCDFILKQTTMYISRLDRGKKAHYIYKLFFGVWFFFFCVWMGLILIKHYTDRISKKIKWNFYFTNWVLPIDFFFFFEEHSKGITVWREELIRVASYIFLFFRYSKLLSVITFKLSVLDLNNFVGLNIELQVCFKSWKNIVTSLW